MKKILIGSPVHQDPEILRCFLNSLRNLYSGGNEFHFLFVDDNESYESKGLLNEFCKSVDHVSIHENELIDSYIRNEQTHHWSERLIWKVATFKNTIIQVACEHGYDYLFLVDSDLVLHPNTILQLMCAEQDIISNVFWTKWQPHFQELPQVWMFDQYAQYSKHRSENLSQQEIVHRQKQFINRLKIPGVYEVGGLGACTLISKKAIKAGNSFAEIKNISFWGEDRHFCIRAQALGFNLYVDTHLPAYHIYRKSDLSGVEAYIQSCHGHKSNSNSDTLLEVLRRGVEGLGSYDFITGYNYDWGEYFDDEIRESLKQQMIDQEGSNIEHKLSVIATVSHIQVIEETPTEALIQFLVSNDGMENGAGFQETFMGQSKLVNRNNKWYIHGLDIFPQESQDDTSFSRLAKENGNRITLSMVVKNESNRFLKDMLRACREYITDALIIDDGSMDDTVSVCYEMLEGIPIKLIKNKTSKFSNEIDLRKQQWEETIKMNPDWILNLDADEIFEKDFKNEVSKLINQTDIDTYVFRLYDFWNMESYREDKYWSAHMSYRPFLIRYQPHFNYIWKETAQHCGRFPQNILELPYAKSNMRLKHLGWARQEDRVMKYERYKKLDPDAKFGWKEQYESILDPNPNLIVWEE